jgi:hypothetical protein
MRVVQLHVCDGCDGVVAPCYEFNMLLLLLLLLLSLAQSLVKNNEQDLITALSFLHPTCIKYLSEIATIAGLRMSEQARTPS